MVHTLFHIWRVCQKNEKEEKMGMNGRIWAVGELLFLASVFFTIPRPIPDELFLVLLNADESVLRHAD